MRLVIAGQGAIGSLLAARCEGLSLDYAVMTKQGEPHPIRFRSLEGDQRCFTPAAIRPASLTGQELLILPLKAYQMVTAIQSLTPHLHRQPLLLLHNGMGVQEEVQALLAGHALIQGITRIAVLKEGQQVLETGRGQTDLCWIRGQDIQAQSLLERVLAPCRWHQDLLPAMWEKLAVNAIINPLTALYGIRNGELAHPSYQTEIRGLCGEIGQLMQALRLPPCTDLETSIGEVVKATATNYSSMYQDLRHGRPTEIDYINGYICKKASELGLPVPKNLALWQQIKAIEGHCLKS